LADTVGVFDVMTGETVHQLEFAGRVLSMASLIGLDGRQQVKVAYPKTQDSILQFKNQIGLTTFQVLLDHASAVEAFVSNPNPNPMSRCSWGMQNRWRCFAPRAASWRG
jgi:hypothetical protein